MGRKYKFRNPEDCVYSSARDYCEIKGLIDVEFIRGTSGCFRQVGGVTFKYSGNCVFHPINNISGVTIKTH